VSSTEGLTAASAAAFELLTGTDQSFKFNLIQKRGQRNEKYPSNPSIQTAGNPNEVE